MFRRASRGVELVHRGRVCSEHKRTMDAKADAVRPKKKKKKKTKWTPFRSTCEYLKCALYGTNVGHLMRMSQRVSYQ